MECVNIENFKNGLVEALFAELIFRQLQDEGWRKKDGCDSNQKTAKPKWSLSGWNSQIKLINMKFCAHKPKLNQTESKKNENIACVILFQGCFDCCVSTAVSAWRCAVSTWRYSCSYCFSIEKLSFVFIHLMC